MVSRNAARRGNVMEQFIRDIIEYFRDPENVKAFEEWKKAQKAGEEP